MAIYPRVNGPIFDSGFNFTPDQFPRAWDLTMAALEMMGGANGDAYSLALWGSGRIAPLSYFDNDTGAAIPATGALAISLPVATYYAADESGASHKITLDVPLVLPVEAGLNNAFVYLQSVLIPDSGDDYTLGVKQTSPTELASLPATGYPAIGKVTSDSNSVTAIDATFATVIFPGALVQSLLRAIAGGNEGDLDPESGVDGATFNAYKNTQKTLTDGLQNQIDALEAKIESLANVDRFPTKIDAAFDEIMHNRNSLSELNPRAIERGNIALVNKNAGHGQNSTPNFSPDTDDLRQLKFDDESGTFGGDVE